MQTQASTEEQHWPREARRLLGLPARDAEHVAFHDFAQSFELLSLPKWQPGQQPRPLGDCKAETIQKLPQTTQALGEIRQGAQACNEAVGRYIAFFNESDAAVRLLDSMVAKPKLKRRDFGHTPERTEVRLPDQSTVVILGTEVQAFLMDQERLQERLCPELDQLAEEALWKEKNVRGEREWTRLRAEELRQQHPGIAAERKAAHLLDLRYDELRTEIFNARLKSFEEVGGQEDQPELMAALRRRQAMEAKLALLKQSRKALVEQVENAQNGAKDKLKIIAECLPVLDAPENNPERVAISRLKERLGLMTEAPAADQLGLMRQLERELNQWVDRRTQQHLPPPAEALFMLDEQRDRERVLLGKVIDEKQDLPLPELDPQEAQLAQTIWRELRDGSGPFKVAPKDEDGRYDKGPYTALWERGVEVGVPGDEQRQALGRTILSSVAKLLQVEAGRSLLAELRATGKPLTLLPAERTSSANLGYPAGQVVMVDAKALDGDSGSISSRTGDPLLSPGPVILGHELIHALHDMRDESSIGKALTEEPEWENAEELETILRGSLSEQTLRHQYGLTMERFGHINRGPSQTGDALIERLSKLARYEEQGGPAIVDELLRSRQLAPESFEVAQRLDLFERLQQSEIRGPLPEGWTPVQLSTEQIIGILAHDGGRGLPYRLGELGWAPYGLAVNDGPTHPLLGGAESLAQITRFGMHHPRSSAGRRFAALGGWPVFTGLARFPAVFRHQLEPWDSADWSRNATALAGWRKRLLQIEDVVDEIAQVVQRSGSYLQMLDKLDGKLQGQREHLQSQAIRMQGVVEDYQQLCTALTRATEAKSIIELLAKRGHEDVALFKAHEALQDVDEKEFAFDAMVDNTITFDETTERRALSTAGHLAEGLVEHVKKVTQQRQQVLLQIERLARLAQR